MGQTGVCHAPTHTGPMDFRSILCATAKHCSACVIWRKSCSENSLRHFRGDSSPVRVWIFRSFHLAVPEAHSGERHQRENASKVATHLAVLQGMDKKTGPRYLPRLNILGCFTLVHAFRTWKPRKLACAMTLPTHTGL